jgi:hypothetical protein
MAKSTLTVIKLDRNRFVKFGHLALKKLSALTGKGLDELDFENFSFDDIETILFCGLLSDAKANNEVLKLEDMEDLLDQADSYQDIIKAMGDAMNKAFSNGEKEKN